MIIDNYGTVWIGTSDGLFEYVFEGLPEVRVPSESISWNISFDNLFIDTNENIYMQNDEGSILAYKSTGEGRAWEEIISEDPMIRDLIVIIDGSNEFLWAARDDNICIWNGIRWEPIISQDAQEEILFEDASFST